MNNKIILACIFLFVFTFSINIFPIRACHSWDETVYLQNAETLFSGRNNYDEFILRPPLISIIFFLAFFIWHSAISATISIVALASLASVFIFLIANKAYDFKTGLFASLLFAVSPFIILNSHFLLTDVAGISLIAISLYYLVRNKNEKDALISGIFFSLTILMKFTYMVFALVFLAYWIFHKTKYRSVFLAILGGLLVITPYLGWAFFAYGNPLTPFINGMGAVSDFNEPVLYFFYHIQDAFNLVVLIGFFIWLIYFCFLIKSRGIKYFKIDLVLLSWILVFLLFLSKTPHKELRYIFPIAVPLVILASRGINLALEKFKYKNLALLLYLLLIIAAAIPLTPGQKNPLIYGDMYINIKNVFYDTLKSDEMLVGEYIQKSLNDTQLIYVRHQWPAVAYYSGKKIEVMPAEWGDYYLEFPSKLKEKQVIVASVRDSGYYYPSVEWLNSVHEFKLIHREGDLVIYGHINKST